MLWNRYQADHGIYRHGVVDAIPIRMHDRIARRLHAVFAAPMATCAAALERVEASPPPRNHILHDQDSALRSGLPRSSR